MFKEKIAVKTNLIIPLIIKRKYIEINPNKITFFPNEYSIDKNNK